MPGESRPAIEAIIDTALRAEPLRPVPLTLHRRVEERIRIAALLEQEKVRFRYSMATLAIAVLGSLALAGLVLSVTNLSDVLMHGVAGGKGQYDSYATSMMQSWSAYRGAYSLLLSIVLAGGTVLLGIIPLRRFITSH